jgi:hypothetical protein
MKNTIGLVGVGSLGGFVADKLQNRADAIYAVDPDIVEERNLRNSIYTKSDINKPKVIALKEKISECKFIPVQADIRRIELPPVKNIIDCRDVVNRNIRTDVKFLIIGKNLKVDCAEPIIEDDQSGKYLIELEKPDVEKAANLAVKTLTSKRIEDLKNKHASINLPLSTENVDDELKFLMKQSDKNPVNRDIGEHIFNDVRGMCDKHNRVRTRLYKLGEKMNIISFEPRPMFYPHVIEMLNEVVLRNGGTYFINRQDGTIEICNPLLEGGA